VSEDKAKRKANRVFHPIGRVALACRPPIHAGGRGLGADRWRGCPSVFVCDAQERGRCSGRSAMVAACIGKPLGLDRVGLR
jgi:hypothetical protein